MVVVDDDFPAKTHHSQRPRAKAKSEKRGIAGTANDKEKGRTKVQSRSIMGRAFVLTAANIALLVTSSVLTGYLLGQWKRKPTPTTQGDGAFVLLVNMTFTSLDLRDKFLKLIEPVCKDVITNESPLGSRSSTKTTLSYQVAVSDKNPLMVVVMERYSDKDNGYLTVHRSGQEFLKFRDLLKEMQERGEVEIAGESYLETSLGYV